MELDEALKSAKRWAAAARAKEKICRKGGYKFMASDCGDEAEVLERLIDAIEKGEKV